MCRGCKNNVSVYAVHRWSAFDFKAVLLHTYVSNYHHANQQPPERSVLRFLMQPRVEGGQTVSYIL